ncbi:MAG TPA: hypothetical protein VES38_02025 [Methylotenera sp.]|nr:hypothetical protein [Methylotenera sp.]
MLSQKKVTKEKATPYRLTPVMLSIMGVNRKLALLKQSIAESPHAAEHHRRGSRGFERKGVEVSLLVDVSVTSLFRHSRENGNPI